MATDPVAPWYRQFWCWFVLAPVIASVFMGLSLVAIATMNADSLVADRYEKVGRALHKSFERQEAAAALGLGGHMVVDREAGRVTLRVDGLDVPPERLRLQLVHPTRAEHDVAVTVRRDASGLYRGEGLRVSPGRRYVRLEPATDATWLLVSELQPGQDELALAPRRPGG